MDMKYLYFYLESSICILKYIPSGGKKIISPLDSSTENTGTVGIAEKKKRIVQGGSNFMATDVTRPVYGHVPQRHWDYSVIGKYPPKLIELLLGILTFLHLFPATSSLTS